MLVDDQALIRTGFKMILEAEDDIEVVGEASDGEEAVSRTRSVRPDVVLMDVQMPKWTVSRPRAASSRTTARQSDRHPHHLRAG